MLKIDVISLLPEMFQALEFGITGKAIKNKLLEFTVTNPRDYTQDKHRTVDDSPYGGGPGMLIKYQPIKDSITDRILNYSNTETSTNKDVKENTSLGQDINRKVIYLSPQGKAIKQDDIKELSHLDHIIFLCGRYEGVDERIIDSLIDEEWSIGDYVISGGELAAMTMIDAVIRLIPGALGDSESASNDSFYNGLLDFPHYTRPEEIDGLKVPEVLLSGNHKKIAEWRETQAIDRTLKRRPDLLTNLDLSDKQRAILESLNKLN